MEGRKGTDGKYGKGKGVKTEQKQRKNKRRRGEMRRKGDNRRRLQGRRRVGGVIRRKRSRQEGLGGSRGRGR